MTHMRPIGWVLLGLFVAFAGYLFWDVVRAFITIARSVFT